MGIHQQVVIDAYPREVYEVLADAASLAAATRPSPAPAR